MRQEGDNIVLLVYVDVINVVSLRVTHYSILLCSSGEQNSSNEDGLTLYLTPQTKASHDQLLESVAL